MVFGTKHPSPLPSGEGIGERCCSTNTERKHRYEKHRISEYVSEYEPRAKQSALGDDCLKEAASRLDC
jgi:hypothetical protein